MVRDVPHTREQERVVARTCDGQPTEPPTSLYDGGKVSLTVSHHIGEVWSATAE